MQFKYAPEGKTLSECNVWDRFYDAMDIGEPLEAKVVGARKINGERVWELYFPDTPGIKGLCPASETGLETERDMVIFVGQAINCKIKGIDKQNMLVICSRRELVEFAKLKLLRSISEGDIIPALVRIVREGSITVDIGAGVLIRIENERANLANTKLNYQYNQGDTIKVQVTKLDKTERVIEVEPVDPWREQRYVRGDVLIGKVVEAKDKLTIVQISPGVVGMYSGKDRYRVGEYVSFQVLRFDPELKLLRLKKYNPDTVNARQRERIRQVILRKLDRRKLEHQKQTSGDPGAAEVGEAAGVS
ncbi:hypothetical protein [Desulfurispora thermophila]|uniref:hypothetical protein n=1 Tax=Desulfurispora thermophila TaxID=265470 RepID=UPI00037784E0|nr:hypothetical protein [Desulfurispora thermophila]